MGRATTHSCPTRSITAPACSRASAATRILRQRRATSSACATIWSALHRTCKISLIDLPTTVDELCDATIELIRKNNLPSCYIRPHRVPRLRRDGRRSHRRPTDVAIAVWPWDSYLGADALDNGVAVGVSSWRQRTNNSIPPAVKATASYMNSILAKLEAKEHGYAEAIMLNEAGLGVRGTGENLFVVRDGVLSTPPLSDGLAGRASRATRCCAWPTTWRSPPSRKASRAATSTSPTRCS